MNEEEIKLIDGVFSPVDAADVLLSLLSYKIKFHTVKKLNEQDDIHLISASDDRIQELREAKKTITDLVINARNQKQQLEIKGTLQIRLKSISN